MNKLSTRKGAGIGSILNTDIGSLLAPSKDHGPRKIRVRGNQMYNLVMPEAPDGKLHVVGVPGSDFNYVVSQMMQRFPGMRVELNPDKEGYVHPFIPTSLPDGTVFNPSLMEDLLDPEAPANKLATRKTAGIGSLFRKIDVGSLLGRSPRLSSAERAANAVSGAGRKMQDLYYDLITARAKSKLAPKYMKEMADQAYPDVVKGKIRSLEDLEQMIAQGKRDEVNKAIMAGGGLVGGSFAVPEIIDQFKGSRAKLATTKDAIVRLRGNRILRDSLGNFLSQADWDNMRFYQKWLNQLGIPQAKWKADRGVSRTISKLKDTFRGPNPESAARANARAIADLATRGGQPVPDRPFVRPIGDPEQRLADSYRSGASLSDSIENLANSRFGRWARRRGGQAGRWAGRGIGEGAANLWENITDPVARARNKYHRGLLKSLREGDIEQYTDATRRLRGVDLSTGGASDDILQGLDDAARQRMLEEASRQARNRALMWGGGMAGGGILASNLLNSGGDARNAYLLGQAEGMQRVASVRPKLAGESPGVPDGTGPYGRGAGPGKGKGDGSGLFGMSPEVKDQMEAIQALAAQYPEKSMTEIIAMFNKRPKLATAGPKVRGGAPSWFQSIQDAYSAGYGHIKRKAQGQYDDNVSAFDSLSQRAGLPVANRTKASRLATKHAMDYNDYYSMAMGNGYQLDGGYNQDQNDELGLQLEYPGYDTQAIKGAKLATIEVPPPAHDSPIEEIVDGRAKEPKDRLSETSHVADQLYGAVRGGDPADDSEYGTPSEAEPKLATKGKKNTSKNSGRASSGNKKAPAGPRLSSLPRTHTPRSHDFRHGKPQNIPESKPEVEQPRPWTSGISDAVQSVGSLGSIAGTASRLSTSANNLVPERTYSAPKYLANNPGIDRDLLSAFIPRLSTTRTLGHKLRSALNTGAFADAARERAEDEFLARGNYNPLYAQR